MDSPPRTNIYETLCNYVSNFDKIYANKANHTIDELDTIATKMLKLAPMCLDTVDFSVFKSLNSNSLGEKILAVKFLEWSQDWEFFTVLLNLCDTSLPGFLQYHVLLALHVYASDHIEINYKERRQNLEMKLQGYFPGENTSRNSLKNKILTTLTSKPVFTKIQEKNNVPILVITDTHGRVEKFEKVVAMGISLAKKLYNCPFPTIVTLGDYCDNGPYVSQLIDKIIHLHCTYEGSIYSIMGNHDLACLCTLIPNFRGKPSADWWAIWSGAYWNPGHGTPTVYGAHNKDEFMCKFPKKHLLWLKNLPWALQIGGYFFVHHGLPKPGATYHSFPQPAPSLPDQLQELQSRDLSKTSTHGLPIYISKKFLSDLSCPEIWPFTVISGHNKFPSRSNFITRKRITFHSGACTGEPLNAALLPPKANLDDPGTDALFFNDLSNW